MLYVVLIILGVAAMLLSFVILPNLAVFREQAGISVKIAEAGGNTWKALGVWFVGMKTLVTAIIGALALAVPEILESLKAMDWSGTALAGYSTTIGLVCIVGMAVFHSIGMKTATLVQPDANAQDGK